MPVSVILPNYNHARWLPRALSALVQQQPAPAEIIVVDDGSTDESVEIIEQFRRSHDFIRLIRHETNQGAEAAVKTALKVASGEFLLFAAADDFVLPGLMARATSALREHPDAAFFCSEVVLIDDGGNIIGFRPAMLPRTTAGYVSPSEARRGLLHSDNWFVGTSVIYRRDCLAEIGFFDSSLATLQDAMATRLLALRNGFYFAPEVLATWRVISESLSMQASLDLGRSEKLISTASTWITNNFPEDIRGAYSTRFASRLRFNTARAHVVWRPDHIDTEGMADVFRWGSLDRAVLKIFSKVPALSSRLLLAWMTIRVRPYALRPMLASLWRSMTVNRHRRSALAPVVNSQPQEAPAGQMVSTLKSGTASRNT